MTTTPITPVTMTTENAFDLRKPFPPESVGKLPKGGAQLDYVGHAAVTDRLLAIDPLWSWEPLGRDTNGLPALTQGGDLWINLTICGVTRIGVGDGASMKVRIGDAIRNAAMRFGVALDLWGKEELVEFRHASERGARVDAPTSRSATDQLRARIPEGVNAASGEIETEEAYAAAGGQEPPVPVVAAAPVAAGITQSQLRALHASFRDAGVDDRTVRLTYCTQLIGRDVESANDLTKKEASTVINALKKDREDNTEGTDQS